MPDIRLTRIGDSFYAYGTSIRGSNLIFIRETAFVDDIEEFLEALPPDFVLVFTRPH